MKKSLIILSFIVGGLFLVFPEMWSQGKEKIKKKVNEMHIHLKTIDPFKEKIPFRRFSKNFRTEKLRNQLYSTHNNTHNLTEVVIWGYGYSDTVFVDGNRAYIGSGRYLILLDISNKTNPIKIGEIMLEGYVNSLFVSSGFAYIANAGFGLKIIDVSNLNNIQELGYYETPDSANGVFVSGSYAYVTAGESGLRIVDISNPSSPQEVGFCDIPGLSVGIYVSGGYAYVGVLQADAGLRIIDVSNPNSPHEVGLCNTPSQSLYLFVTGNYAYNACGNSFRIINVSDPTSPQQVGVYETPSGSGEEIYVVGNYAYFPTDNGLRVVDISNPSSPQEVGYCATPGIGLGICISGNYAYVADGSSGLRVVDVKTTSSPNEIGSYVIPGAVPFFNPHISGNYAYIASMGEGVSLFDISNTNSAQFMSLIDTPGFAWSVYVSGNYAYVADDSSGLRVIDFSNPGSPQEVGSYDTQGTARDVCISGNYAYLADDEEGLRVIDVSTPSSPQEVGFYNTSGQAVGVYVSGSYVYVADGNEGIRLIDVSNVGSPEEVGYYDTDGFAFGVHVSGSYAFVADGIEGLRVIDFPEEKGYYDTNGFARGVDVSGNYAYVADGSGGLRVIDVSNIVSPQEVAFHTRNANNLHIYGDYIYVTNWAGFTRLQHVTTPSVISINRDRLNYGCEIGGDASGPHNFSISNSGGGTLNWTVSDNADWLNCSPLSGTGSGVVTVSVDPTGLSSGTYSGTISVEDTNASNSPQTIDVSLEVYSSGSTSAPFGSFETPVHGSTVQSSVPVTGWAIDDIGVMSVKIYRGDGKNLAYIGDGLFVEGARPDIEQAFPGYPMNYKAGWGYMMLTNFLPNGGNGTFTFHAIATDWEGNQVTLGTKTVLVDNASAVKPFGAIDTPTQGGTASGSNFRNQGWVLTPMPNSIPTDGSTISVIVDGINLGHPTYNIYRSDIATLFPGYANSDGALAYFDFDTTTYSDGVHTIAWIATDDAGNSDGIGSRYFSIQNSHGARSMGHGVGLPSPGVVPNVSNIPIDYSIPVRVKKGFNRKVKPFESYPDDNGFISVDIRELERIEIYLNDYQASSNNSKFKIQNSKFYSGYQVTGNQLTSLPIGSTLDRERGIFYWQPGPGLIGFYRLLFIKEEKNGELKKKMITVRIVPKFRRTADVSFQR